MPPVLATDVLASLVRMDSRRPGMLTRIVSSFRESVGDCIEGLWEALARAEPSRIRDLTHRLAGTSSQMGAAALAEACGALSRAAESPDAVQRMCELEILADRSLAELDEAAARSSSS